MTAPSFPAHGGHAPVVKPAFVPDSVKWTLVAETLTTEERGLFLDEYNFLMAKAAAAATAVKIDLPLFVEPSLFDVALIETMKYRCLKHQMSIFGEHGRLDTDLVSTLKDLQRRSEDAREALAWKLSVASQQSVVGRLKSTEA